MTKFTYKGEDKKGAEVIETVDAADRFDVYEIARQNGHTVESISEKKAISLEMFLDVKKIEYYISRVKDDDLVMMTRNLGSMLVAGLPLTRALSVIERQSTNPRLKGVLASIRERISKGDQFYQALGDFPKEFDDLYVSMVKAGEESGGLSDALQTLSIQMERSSSLKKKIKGAMIYPSIILTAMSIIGVLMMIFVMPSITGTFKDMEIELPATTKTIIAVSDFMTNNTMVFLGSVFLVIAGVSYGLRTKYGKIGFSWLVVRLPAIGNIAKEANAARTARTLSSLLSAGVDVLRSISITEEVMQNHFYKKILKEAGKRVEKGQALSEVFIENPKLYPVLVGEMISVGEETGQISEMLEQMAVFYENEVEHKTKDLSTIIEPVLMLVIGGGVGFFALAMIAPIYGIADSI